MNTFHGMDERVFSSEETRGMTIMKKMLKIMVAVALLITLLFSVTAFAAPTKEEQKVLKTMVHTTNQAIKKMVKAAQKTPYDDVPLLLAAVDLAVAPVFAYADMIGAEVVCEYDYYEIDGQTVAIDPLKVINATRIDK